MQWTGGRPHDDMALLVARRSQAAEPEEATADAGLFLGEMLSWEDGAARNGTGEGDGGGEGEGTQAGAGEKLFGFRFPSRADCAAEVRQAIGHWMPALGFDRAATEDFQTAVTEAVTNAVRHGSPGGDGDEFGVTAYRTPDGSLRVEVTDGGDGVPLSPLPRAMPAPDALSGRGLPLMHHLADSVEFRQAAVGHSVVLLKRRPNREGK